MNTPQIISAIVNNDLCIGCGLCVYKCPNHALEMKWNRYGFLIPELTGDCDSFGSCVSVCPFNPFPDKEVKTEDELAKLIFTNSHQKYHTKIGWYIGIYAGYANEFRLTSSSGGIATYIFAELLERGIVDYVFSVKESQKKNVYYEYAVSSSKEELLNASKTKYFPVTLGTVLQSIHKLKGKVAVVGVACFIKAIRLAQHKEPGLKEKIPFLVGIICGGVKSRFFAEYLAGRAGVSVQDMVKPQFRIKDLNSNAGDYAFGCFNKEENKEYTIKMRTVGDMWGTGFFKNNACDFCDDVTTELADISLGDAWMPPYIKDGAGTNVVVARSLIASELIRDGIIEGDLSIEPLPKERFLASLKGSFNHRHNGLSYRIKRATIKGKIVPPKRIKDRTISYLFKLVQILRRVVRHKSLKLWSMNNNYIFFNKKINKISLLLHYTTKIYHLEQKILRAINKDLRI
jgi:coenzyme F420-reducing hydrogenase beta subunit